MRKWTLGSADPLSLTLAADARYTSPDYNNDHIWELGFGGGEPAALSLKTTYGLRARSMRIFLNFSEDGEFISDPAAFLNPPLVSAFYANFLEIQFSPLKDLDVTAEYWVPDSHTIAGRLTFANRSTEEREIGFQLAAVLAPIEGVNFQPEQIQSVNILAGETENLAPVIFLQAAHHTQLHPTHPST